MKGRSPLWQGLAKPKEIHKYIGQTITVMLSGLNAPFVLWINIEHHRRINIRTVLKFLDGKPP